MPILNAAGDTLETRERVPHAQSAAHHFQRERMNTIGVVSFPRANESLVTTSYFAFLLEGILNVARSRKQSTLLMTEYPRPNDSDNLPVYCDGRCDGLLFVSPPANNEIFLALKERAIPFVLIGDDRQDSYVTCIDIDNVGAAQKVTDHLLDLGHRRIALLGGESKYTISAERILGYRRAFARRSLPVDESLIFAGSYSENSGYQSARLVMQMRPEKRPTALFCSDDLIAVGVLRAMAELGVRVPQDVSVVGFDDIPMASLIHPQLTTIRQPLGLMGETAAEILLAQIDGALPLGQKCLLPIELIIRESTAPPPSEKALV